MHKNHLDHSMITAGQSTNGSNQYAATQSGQAGLQDRTLLSQSQIQSWLQGINSELLKVGRLRMTDREIDGFAEKLAVLGYTARKARIAEKYLIYARWSNYKNPAVQIEYFNPSPAELTQFEEIMITVDEHEAQMRELQRQFAVENLRLSDEKNKIDRMYREACIEIARLNREPTTPVVITDEERENLKNGRLYLQEQSRRIVSEEKLASAFKEIARLERLIEKIEKVKASTLADSAEKVGAQNAHLAV